MGIHCEIKLYKPVDGAFKPGSTVSGILKYTTTEEAVYNKIIVSFKGNGYLIVKHKQRENNLYTHRKSEEYVDIDYVIHFNQKNEALPIGSYETQFSFNLPENIPPSIKYRKVMTKYLIQCYINYYIRLKFERNGLLKPLKKFKKEIPIISVIKPKLSTELTVYGEKTMIPQFLSKKKGTIHANATIEKSVLLSAEKVKIDCDIKNETKYTIRQITARLVEVYTFKSKAKTEVTAYKDFKDTLFVYSGVSIGETKTIAFELTIPSSISSVENCNLFSRDYFVIISVFLRENIQTVMKIPIQIGDEIQETDNCDDLPSYWEVMQQDNEFHRRHSLDDSSDDSNGWI